MALNSPVRSCIYVYTRVCMYPREYITKCTRHVAQSAVSHRDLGMVCFHCGAFGAASQRQILFLFLPRGLNLA